MVNKHIFALIAMCCTTVNGTVYVYSVLRRDIKPHIFSWFIWALIMAIAFGTQYVGGAGVGVWPTGYAAIMCLTVTILSFTRGEKTITRSDWISFLGALAAIPLWVITNTPLGAVLLITIIDALGFYPTFRKSYRHPWQEKLSTFITGGVVAVFTTLALERYSLTTALYPVSLIFTHLALAGMLLWRRRYITK